MSEKELKQQEFYKDLYPCDKQKVKEALEKGISVADLQEAYEKAPEYLDFRICIDALASGLTMEHVDYLFKSDLKYIQANNAVRCFRKGVTIEQAKKYFNKDMMDSQIGGVGEVLTSTTEEKAEPYITKPFRLKQFKCIAHGFKKGYTEEQMKLFSSPDTNFHTMQAICDMIDKGADAEYIRILTEQPFSTKQLEVLLVAVHNKMPVDKVKILANKKYSHEKMRYLLQGYRDGFSTAQLLALSMVEPYEESKLPELYEQLLNGKDHVPAICSATTYEALKDSIIKAVPGLSRAQKKELMDLILFGED